MRTIKFTNKFKKDISREKKGRHKVYLKQILQNALHLLATDSILPKSYVDHALVGNWKDCRDCHLKPDLILIYRKLDDDILELVRIGSHSELGL